MIEVSVAADAAPRRPGIIVHRRAVLSPADSLCSHGVRVTTPVCTLVDIALRLSDDRLEAAINEADKRGFVDPERLRAALDSMAGRHGVTAVRSTLDRRTFVPTGSELERRFIPIARAAGLAPPQTRQEVCGFRVDFFWPELGLVVETDGLSYHRTPAQQARDRLRDQVHTAAGLTPLRFTMPRSGSTEITSRRRWRRSRAGSARELNRAYERFGGP